MKNFVTVSAPGKLMLLGEHAVVYGYPCIVTAVDQRMKLSAKITDNQLFELTAPEVGILNYSKQIELLGKREIAKGAKFVELAVAKIYQKNQIKSGIKIETKSDFASTVGFGSSSASCVCTIQALSKLFSLQLSNKDILYLAYEIVLEVQGVGSGFDIASSIYGGNLYFVKGGKVIEALGDLELPLVVGYTGVKADTSKIVKVVAEKMKKDKIKYDKIFIEIGRLVEIGKSQLHDENWENLGETMTKNHNLLQNLGVSSPKLDAMVETAINGGAWGAKLSGAGGGDCMIALVDETKRKQVEENIQKIGGSIINLHTSALGLGSFQ